jgi:outer membrane protein, protease secretion system
MRRGWRTIPSAVRLYLPKVATSYNQNRNQSTQWGAQYTGGPNVSSNWSYLSNYSYLQLTQPIFSLEALARWRQGVLSLI